MESLTHHRFEARATLIPLGAIQLVNGIWATLAPRSFYDDFPLGIGGWVSALPEYNEHLMRDVGGLFLATGFILLAASVRLERRLVVIALVSYLLFSIPHAIFHFFNLEPYGTGDAIGNVVALAATVLLPLGLLVLLSRGEGAPARRRAGEPDGSARIAGVPEKTRNPVIRGAYWESRRRYGSVMDPLRVYAHHPKVMMGYARARDGGRALAPGARAAQAPGRAPGGDAAGLRVVLRLRLVAVHRRRRNRGRDARSAGL